MTTVQYRLVDTLSRRGDATKDPLTARALAMSFG